MLDARNAWRGHEFTTLNYSMVKEIVGVETNKFTIDSDHHYEVHHPLVSHLFEQLFSNLYIDVQRSDHLVMN